MNNSLFLSFAVWVILCSQTCVSLEEYPAQEGKELTLECSGKITKSLKQIWWTAKKAHGNQATILSKCYIGQKDCHNYNSLQYTADFSGQYKYTSKLTIRRVSADHRDYVINCVEDDIVQSFKLEVYHIPESTVCKAQKISRGRIEVSCNTSKVYPGIICEIEEEFQNTTDLTDGEDFTVSATHDDIHYTLRTFKDGTMDYNAARCLVNISPRFAGSYRFLVKMRPNVTNVLVTPVVGYTNTVTVHAPADRSWKDKHVSGNKEEPTTTSDMGIPNIAEPLTGDKNYFFSERQTVNEEATMTHLANMCKSEKEDNRKQLLVILILTGLLVCMFLFNTLLLFRNMCRTGLKYHV